MDLLWLVVGVGVYLSLSLFAGWRTPFLLGGDQVYFWMDGQRILDGEVIFRDFFRFTPPGIGLVYAGAFKIFGARIWVTNAVVLTLGVAYGVLFFLLARRLMSRGRAVLAAAFFEVFVYGKALNATHHWFAVLMVGFAVLVSFECVTSKRLFASGALLGVAAFFTQTHGVAALAAFVVFLVLRKLLRHEGACGFLKLLGSLLLGFALAVLLLYSHTIFTVGLSRVWYCEVTYVLEYGTSLSGGGWLGLPGVFTLRTLPRMALYLWVYAVLPVTYGVSLWRCWRQRRGARFPWNSVALLALVGLFLLLEVAMSLSWLRLFTVSMPGVLLAFWIPGGMSKSRRTAAAFWMLVVVEVAVQIHGSRANFSMRADLPAGRAAVTRVAYDKLTWIGQRMKPGEYFLQAAWPGMYLPLHLRNPLSVSTLNVVDSAASGDVSLALEQLKGRRVRYVLWAKLLDRPCGGEAECSDSLSAIREYLKEDYSPVQRFSDGDVVYEREASGSKSQSCSVPRAAR